MSKITRMIILTITSLLIMAGMQLGPGSEVRGQRPVIGGAVARRSVTQSSKGMQRVKRCRATAQTGLIKKVEAKGEGCTKAAARKAAFEKIAANNCTGAHDPKCEVVTCAESNQNCKPITMDFSHQRISYKRINKEGCRDGKGWECTLSGDFRCGCGCR